MIQDLLSNCAWSLAHVAGGASLGIFLGAIVGSTRYLLSLRFRERWPVTVLFEFLRFPPPIAWLPFVVLLFGVGSWATMAVVCMATFPAVATNFFEGLRSVPIPIRRFAASLELSALARLRAVYIPAVLPQLCTGIRLGLGIGWMSVIAAEMVGGQGGLGYSIQINRVYLQYSAMAADIVAIGLIGFVFHSSLSYIEKSLSPVEKKTL